MFSHKRLRNSMLGNLPQNQRNELIILENHPKLWRTIQFRLRLFGILTSGEQNIKGLFLRLGKITYPFYRRENLLNLVLNSTSGSLFFAGFAGKQKLCTKNDEASISARRPPVATTSDLRLDCMAWNLKWEAKQSFQQVHLNMGGQKNLKVLKNLFTQ